MLFTIAVILLVLWLLGMVSGYTLGNFIYVLLVIALVLFVVGLVSGRRTVCPLADTEHVPFRREGRVLWTSEARESSLPPAVSDASAAGSPFLGAGGRQIHAANSGSPLLSHTVHSLEEPARRHGEARARSGPRCTTHAGSLTPGVW
jgi:hypothetical protein